jgi:HlyD family secretion protein
MFEPRRGIFRERVSDRSLSPEHLDQLLPVVAVPAWVPLASAAALVCCGLVWSVLGRLPVTVEGEGLLVYPRRVVPVQAPASGVLTAFDVRVGERVRRGQVLGVIGQSELTAELEQLRLRRSALTSQDTAAGALQQRRTTQEARVFAQQRQDLAQRLAVGRRLAPEQHRQALTAWSQERTSLEETQRALEPLLPTLARRVEERRKLHQKGAIAGDELLRAEQEWLQAREKIAQLETKLATNARAGVELQRTHQENLAALADLERQIKELDSKQTVLAQDAFTATADRRNLLLDTERQIRRLEVQFSTQSRIVSPYDGRILEVTLTPGQRVTPGVRVAGLNAELPGSTLTGTIYLPAREGKKVRPGLAVQVTPATVERARFGGIIGRVASVSPFPVTRQGAATSAGSPEALASLAPGEPLIEVQVTLRTNPATVSGFAWSSSAGPPVRLSPGTPATARITLEEIPPIWFVLPLLRSASGVY